MQTLNWYFSFTGNPIICSCQSYAQKLWLRRHRKWLDTVRRGSKVGPQCQEPTPILNRHLLSVKDSELCPLPSVNSLQLSQIEPTSFLVTWDSPDTNMTGLRGFIVAYHRIDKNDQVKKYRLSPSIRGFQVGQISDDSSYRVCVVTRGSSYKRTMNSHQMSINLQNSLPKKQSFSLNTKREKKKNKRKQASPERIVDDDDYDIEEVQDEDITLAELTRKEIYSILPRTIRSPDEMSEHDINAKEKVLIDDSGSIMISDQFVFTSPLTNNEVVNDMLNESLVVPDLPVYPSSNDTGLIVLKPAVVNLGSQSSKCTEIHTPMDPSKMSLVDNKRNSVIIGVVAGLVVFTCIIMSIVTKPSFKDAEDTASTGAADSLSGSTRKSPAESKHATDTHSDSVHFSNPNAARHSRSDSPSSSIVNRVNIVGDGGSIVGGSTNPRNGVGERNQR